MSGLTSQVSGNKEMGRVLLKIPACELEIFPDERFVSALRPTDRLDAPEEALQRLPGVKAGSSHRSGSDSNL